MCIEYWGVTNLKPDERNTKGHKITYNCKQISNILTRLSEKYKDFVNDYIVEFINDFNDIKNEATGGNFQSKLFQVDDEKIISLQNKPKPRKIHQTYISKLLPIKALRKRQKALIYYLT